MSGSLHTEHPADLLPDYVRGRLDEAREVERHLEGCEHCRVEVEILAALRDSGPAPLTDAERERAFPGPRSGRTAAGPHLGRTGPAPPRWLSATWRIAAGIALLLTSVGVWQVVRVGSAGWDPDTAIAGWSEDLADLELEAGDVRVALGVGLLDDPGFGTGWAEALDAEGEEGVEIGEIPLPWEEGR